MRLELEFSEFRWSPTSAATVRGLNQRHFQVAGASRGGVGPRKLVVLWFRAFVLDSWRPLRPRRLGLASWRSGPGGGGASAGVCVVDPGMVAGGDDADVELDCGTVADRHLDRPGPLVIMAARSARARARKKMSKYQNARNAPLAFRTRWRRGRERAETKRASGENCFRPEVGAAALETGNDRRE